MSEKPFGGLLLIPGRAPRLLSLTDNGSIPNTLPASRGHPFLELSDREQLALCERIKGHTVQREVLTLSQEGFRGSPCRKGEEEEEGLEEGRGESSEGSNPPHEVCNPGAM